MSKTISEIYNRVINHAISLGIDADQFLTCWREGDWAGCREFGFEPDIDGAEGSAQRTSIKSINGRILAALEESTSALFYLVEAKHGPKTASGYPEIVAARAVIAEAIDQAIVAITTNGTTRLVPRDEPVFLIRGQDAVGAEAVRTWATMAEAIGASPEILHAAREQAAKMDAWPKKKTPDIQIKEARGSES